MKGDCSKGNMQKVKQKGRWECVMLMSTFLIFCLWGKPVSSDEQNNIQFGTFITQSNIWNKDVLGVEFSPEQAIELKLDDETVLFYHDEPSWAAFVFVLQHTQKRMLWKSDWLGPSAHVPVPVLAAGNFNGNQKPDLLFCYSIDRGIGKSAEHWTQNMYLFFDNEQTIEQPLSLSVVDIFLCDPDEEKMIGCKPSRDRLDSLVMLLPAWGWKLTRKSFENLTHKGIPASIIEQLILIEDQVFAEEVVFLEAVEDIIGEEHTNTYKTLILQYVENDPYRMYIWSRREMWSSANDSYSLTYQITNYEQRENHVVADETVTGTYASTSAKLQNVLQQRQMQEGAPAPILLNFLKPPPNYLCEEEEWFRFLKH